MWCIARNLVGGVAVLLAVVCSSAQAQPSRLIEPLFGLSYAPGKVRFEPLPDEVVRRCPGLFNAQWDRRLWVFGTTEHHGTNYWVVGGYYLARPGTSVRGTQLDLQGAVLAVSGEACELLGPARETLEISPDPLPAEVLPPLQHDIRTRFLQAFGSERAWHRALARQHIQLPPSGHQLSPVLHGVQPPSEGERR